MANERSRRARGIWAGAAFFFLCAPVGEALARTAPPRGRTSGDLVILRDGRVEKGTLAACINDRCQLSGKSLARDTIAWIGFSTAIAAPPTARGMTEDETHLRDGTVQSGHLVGVGLSEVVTERDSYDRPLVAWIHLAPAGPPGPGDQPTQIGAPPSEPPAPASPPGQRPHQQPPPPPPTGGAPGGSSPPGPSSGHQPVKPCPAAQPLGGRIEVESEWNVNGCRGSKREVLRFPLVDHGPTADPWWSRLWLGFEASEIDYEVSTGGCSGVTANGEETCNAPAGRKAGRVTMGRAGPRGFTAVPGLLGYLNFHPARPQISAENLPDEMSNGLATPLECVGPHSHSKNQWGWGFGAKGFAVNPAGKDCPPADMEGFIACTPPTDCAFPVDEPARVQCMTHSDRHAVLPFSGDAHWQSARAADRYYQGLTSTHLQWKICCGCGAAPAPPEPGEDPCGSSALADGELQRNRDERAAKLAELRAAGAEYEAELAKAQAHYADYAKTVEACLIQSLGSKLLIALLAPEVESVEGVEAAIGAAEAVDAEELVAALELAEQQGLFPPTGLQLLAKIIEKMVNGEDPTTALAAEGAQNFDETLAVLQKVENVLSGPDVAQMEKTIEECQGAIGVSAETKLSAEKCVEEFKAALGHLTEVHERHNDIRDLDTAYPDLQYKAWAACVQHARCAGTPESDCAGKKPAGNWPDVP